jgi:excisionase family DNA binding protein
LNVEVVLVPRVGSQAIVEVVLKRNDRDVTDWILRDLDDCLLKRANVRQRPGPMTGKSRLCFEELPDILTPKDLIKYLPIGRDAVYQALQSQVIPNVRIGQKFIIPKSALREFLGGAVECTHRPGPISEE